MRITYYGGTRMSRTREERRLRRRRRLTTGLLFTLFLLLCLWLPGLAEAVIVDEPAGIYAEVSRDAVHP